VSNRRLLITGARGFVGRHVVAAAVEAGFEVHGAARAIPCGDEVGAVHWHVADLLAEGVPAQVVAEVRPTHLLHAAWETTHGSYWASPDNVLWIAVTARLAHAFASAGGCRFVLVGTCAEYDWSQGVMVESLTPAHPHTLYGACKLAAHDMLQALASSAGFTAVTGRIFSAYGPHENARRLIPYVSRTLAAGETALLSSGRQIRDFLHVDDVARAFVTLLEGTVTGAVNIGMGEPVRLSEITGILEAASGTRDQVRIGARPDRADDVPVIVPDTRRLRALGWKPRTSLEQGLAETYAWWAKQVKG
jgi:nucleoside-diphosphate-sugar epimerase